MKTVTATKPAATIKKQTVKFRLLETYLAIIKNSPGTQMFRNLYADVNGITADITRDGQVSCAFFASSVLASLTLIKSSHATVASTVKDLRQNNWQELELESGIEPPIGSVLIWGKKDFGNGEFHAHIGFYIGNGLAISNDEKKGCPTEHPWQSNQRKIESIFWNSKLEEK